MSAAQSGGSERLTVTVELTEPELELLAWRLCQPNYDHIGGYWERHHTGQTPSQAGFDLYQRLMALWEEAAWSAA